MKGLAQRQMIQKNKNTECQTDDADHQIHLLEPFQVIFCKIHDPIGKADHDHRNGKPVTDHLHGERWPCKQHDTKHHI